jgi:hypothetical protein
MLNPYLKVNLKDVATQTLDGIIKGYYVDTFSVLNVGTGVEITDIAKLHTNVISRHCL